MNRFTRIDPVDRVPEEIWMELCHIEQEAVTKTIPKKKKCKKAKWLSKERREAKRQEGKGKTYPISHSSRDQQGELRKPS